MSLHSASVSCAGIRGPRAASPPRFHRPIHRAGVLGPGAAFLRYHVCRPTSPQSWSRVCTSNPQHCTSDTRLQGFQGSSEPRVRRVTKHVWASPSGAPVRSHTPAPSEGVPPPQMRPATPRCKGPRGPFPDLAGRSGWISTADIDRSLMPDGTRLRERVFQTHTLALSTRVCSANAPLHPRDTNAPSEPFPDRANALTTFALCCRLLSRYSNP